MCPLETQLYISITTAEEAAYMCVLTDVNHVNTPYCRPTTHHKFTVAGTAGVARNLLRGKRRGSGDRSPPNGSSERFPVGGWGKAPRSWRQIWM